MCYTLDQPAAVTVHAMALVLAVHLQYLTVSILYTQYSILNTKGAAAAAASSCWRLHLESSVVNSTLVL